MKSDQLKCSRFSMFALGPGLHFSLTVSVLGFQVSTGLWSFGRVAALKQVRGSGPWTEMPSRR